MKNSNGCAPRAWKAACPRRNSPGYLGWPGPQSATSSGVSINRRSRPGRTSCWCYGLGGRSRRVPVTGDRIFLRWTPDFGQGVKLVSVRFVRSGRARPVVRTYHWYPWSAGRQAIAGSVWLLGMGFGNAITPSRSWLGACVPRLPGHAALPPGDASAQAGLVGGSKTCRECAAWSGDRSRRRAHPCRGGRYP